MTEVKGINFIEVGEKLKPLLTYKAEDIFQTHTEEEIQDFITSLMIQKMRGDIFADTIRELLNQFQLLNDYPRETYEKALQDINELLEMVLNK